MPREQGAMHAIATTVMTEAEDLGARATAATHAGIAAVERMLGLDDGPTARMSGELYADGRPSADDVVQGELDDCWLLSACAAVARTNPDALRRLIRDNHDGTYDVTLYAAGLLGQRQAHTVRVDTVVPRTEDGTPRYASSRGLNVAWPDSPEPLVLWPLLIEKAYAQLHGGYASLKGLRSGVQGLFGMGFDSLLPGASSEYVVEAHTPAETFAHITQALHERRPVTATTHAFLAASTRSRAEELGLVDRHVYAVKATHPDRRTLDLQDPHGSDAFHPYARSPDDLALDDFVAFYSFFTIGPRL